MTSFKELLNASMKSKDTEEWLDVYFTRPVGLAIALMCRSMRIHPNTVTVISIFLGIGSAYMFWHTDITHNIIGIVLLMLANFCDSADGQLARLTGQKTLVGRVLDGFAGDVWFFCIYLALCLRMMPQEMPGTGAPWGWWIFIPAFVAGVLCHSPQASLADYYRQIHLFFLKGDSGSELDDSKTQREKYGTLPRDKWLERLFYYNYANYCRSQERRTPRFQELKKAANIVDVRDEFLKGSRPLMAYTNLLTFNSRAICIYVTCLSGCPWVYFLLEITLYNIMYIHMRHRHETLCKKMLKKLHAE